MISDYDVVLTVTAVAVSTAATTMTDETKGERKHRRGQTDIDYNRRKLKGHYEIVSDRLMSTFNIDTEM